MGRLSGHVRAVSGSEPLIALIGIDGHTGVIQTIDSDQTEIG